MTNPDAYVLGELVARIEANLIDQDIPQEKAREAAHSVEKYLRNYWGGQKVYIHKRDREALKERNRQIQERWNGRNTSELCREFDLSENRLRQIADSKQSSPRNLCFGFD